MMLRRYWFQFQKCDQPSILNLGCGVTAFDEADAIRLIQEKVFPHYGVREIKKVVVDVDIRTLDEGHVRPNMASPVVRGVWFPLL
jgi:hypothetical protein